jgi:hypothetical protein
MSCGTDRLDIPDRPGAVAQAARPLGTPQQLATIAASLDEAGTRLTASLDDRVGAAILRIHLGELAARIEAGDRPGARRALASTRAALGRAGSLGAADSAGSAVRLALERVEALLNARDLTQGPEPARLDSTGGVPATRQ